MKRNYDLLTPVYDHLVLLVYGKALHKAQVRFLPFIPAHVRVLVAGGGTGWILEEIARVHPGGLQIDYLDISAAMIRKARQRQVGGNRVTFIHSSILDWHTDTSYDVVITPFFFDNFSEQTALRAFSIIHNRLKANGIWIYTDFQVPHRHAYWQKLLLRIMYTFFRVVAGIEARRLPDMTSLFHRHGYKVLESETSFRKFILASLYKKLIPAS